MFKKKKKKDELQEEKPVKPVPDKKTRGEVQTPSVNGEKTVKSKPDKKKKSEPHQSDSLFSFSQTETISIFVRRPRKTRN